MARTALVFACVLGLVASARGETPAFDFAAAQERGGRAVAKRAHTDVIAIFTELVMRAPRSTRACSWQVHVTRAWLSLPRATLAQRTKAVGYLALLYETMHYRNDLPDYEDAECKRMVAAFARELATIPGDMRIAEP